MARNKKKSTASTANPPAVRIAEKGANGVLTVEVSGSWELGTDISGGDELFAQLDEQDFNKLLFVCSDLPSWDSSLLIYLRRVEAYCAGSGASCDFTAMTCGVLGLLDMATSAMDEPPGPPAHPGFLHNAGEIVLTLASDSAEMFSFIGEFFMAFLRLLTGRARVRREAFISALYQSGPASLGIVGMISLLVGLVMAFIGAAQLRLFGAQIFVADMVSISMLREMGAIMTGIILSGRVGASYAATLGTMQVNEEIDALQTLGISPVDFLILPRVLAMAMMTPLLVLYADVMGILGGAAVGVFILDIAPLEYYYQTVGTVGNMANLSIGLVKGLIFGVLVAMSGCRRGLKCGRSSEAVGQATTSAVVSAIVYIVVADALLAVLCQVLAS